MRRSPPYPRSPAHASGTPSPRQSADRSPRRARRWRLGRGGVRAGVPPQPAGVPGSSGASGDNPRHPRCGALRERKVEERIEQCRRALQHLGHGNPTEAELASGDLAQPARRTNITAMTPVEGFYLDSGWGTWGFKATPVCGKTMSYTVAKDEDHELIRGFRLSRFVEYKLTGEKGAASVGH